MSTILRGLPEEINKQINNLMLKLVQADSARLFFRSPQQDISFEAFSNLSSRAENKQLWRADLHLHFYDDTGVTVLSNAMPLTDDDGRQNTGPCQGFSPAHGYYHSVDMFFRQEGKAIGVLTLLRVDKHKPFTHQEIKLLEDLQPFIEYVLNQLHLPRFALQKQHLSDRYDLTSRELDVVEHALTGLSNKELIKRLAMSLPTLRTHLQNIYVKLGVRSNCELISKVFREAQVN